MTLPFDCDYPSVATLPLRTVASKSLLVVQWIDDLVLHKEEENFWKEGMERNLFIRCVFELEKVCIFKCQFRSN